MTNVTIIQFREKYLFLFREDWDFKNGKAENIQQSVSGIEFYFPRKDN